MHFDNRTSIQYVGERKECNIVHSSRDQYTILQAMQEAVQYAPLLYAAAQLQPIHALRLRHPARLAS